MLIFIQAGEWHGWEMPNPRFLQTKKLLEDLIINTQCQRDSSYSDILEEYINLDRDNLLQMESYELKEQCSEEFHEVFHCNDLMNITTMYVVLIYHNALFTIHIYHYKYLYFKSKLFA